MEKRILKILSLIIHIVLLFLAAIPHRRSVCQTAPSLWRHLYAAKHPRRLGQSRHPSPSGFSVNPSSFSFRCSAERRSEEHTSELQSLMRISYAVFCLKKKNTPTHTTNHNNTTRY